MTIRIFRCHSVDADPMSKKYRTGWVHRMNLLILSPYCANCGAEVFEYDWKLPGTVPDRAATIQHVFHPPRPEQGRTVLWCHACNQAEGLATNKGAKLPFQKIPVPVRDCHGQAVSVATTSSLM